MDVGVERVFVVGDRVRSVHAFLRNADGTPVDLTSPAGQTVKFRMVPEAGGTPKVADANAAIVNGATGEVRYDWAAADVDTAGTFYAWFIRTVGGLTDTFPAGKGEATGKARLFKIVLVEAG